jgi:hypothetical protein
MPQFSTSLTTVPGVAGQIYDLSAIGAGDIISAVAGEVIPFGVLCELNASGTLQPVQDINADWPPVGTAAGTSLAGISIYDPEGVMQDYLGSAPTIPPTGEGSSTSGYPKGYRVPVLRRGRIWMQFDGQGVPTRIGPVNVWHSSTTGLQGVITFTATSGTAGSEVSQAGAYLESFNPDLVAGEYTDAFNTTAGIIACNINLPGSGS